LQEVRLAAGETISINNLKKLLEAKGIKPSYQRLCILEYIIKKNIHPSVDTIYKALYKNIPTLSRTTIYNTLNLFEKRKIVSFVSALDNELRYEFLEKPHAHFLCIECKEVYDIYLETDIFCKEFVEDHKVAESHIHFRGLCKKCLEKASRLEKKS
jgi:Fe2+ or Zn2+ uptake regulation protein